MHVCVCTYVCVCMCVCELKYGVTVTWYIPCLCLPVCMQELAEREKLVREREQVALERAALETKQLHCSQAMSRDLTRLSVQIQSLDSSIRASENGTQGLLFVLLWIFFAV